MDDRAGDEQISDNLCRRDIDKTHADDAADDKVELVPGNPRLSRRDTLLSLVKALYGVARHHSKGQEEAQPYAKVRIVDDAYRSQGGVEELLEEEGERSCERANDKAAPGLILPQPALGDGLSAPGQPTEENWGHIGNIGGEEEVKAFEEKL